MSAMTKTEPTFDDRLDKLEAQCTDLFRQLRNERDTSRAQAEVIAGMAAKIEEMQSRNEQQGRINQDALQRFVSICQRLDHHNIRLPTLTLGELAAEGKRYACTGQAIEPAKPTIKGGWVNVYASTSDSGRYFAPPAMTRREADRSASPDRIACIQIPDITVGEGLCKRASELTAADLADFIRFGGDAGGGV